MAGTLKHAGKVAVITAGTKGIGFAAARRLGLEGAKVVVSSRKEMNVISAVAKLKTENIDAHGVVCHAAKTEDVQNLLKKAEERYGGIDILFSNIGISTHYGPVLECPETAWDKNFEVNVKSNFTICKEVVPYMEKRGGGSIVVNSTAGAFKMVPVILTYCIAKLALCGMVKALIFELSPKNIRINAIAPAVIETEFSESMWRPESDVPVNPENTSHMISKFKQHLNSKDEDVVRKWVLSTYTTASRFGTAEECAKVVSFLASEDSSYITGESIVVAGGIDCSV